MSWLFAFCLFHSLTLRELIVICKLQSGPMAPHFCHYGKNITAIYSYIPPHTALELLLLLTMETNQNRLILRKLSLFLFICGMAMSFAVGAAEKDTAGNNISSADHVASILIKTLPNSSLKNGLLRYYQILDPSAYSDDQEVADSNSGVSRYFQHHFGSNACFARKSLLFYSDLRRTTRQEQKTSPDEVRHNRPSLGDKAGASRKDLNAGWLYEKALQYSNGNPNAALSLIGLCGHDDVNQGLYFNEAEEDKLISEGYKPEDLYIKVQNEEEEEETLCPAKTADFFVPGSLSAEADMSESLKKKVLKVQYPGKKAEQIAAKNYHVLGAAFMTCQMIEAGMNPTLAVQVEAMAANLYRGIRLCQNIELPAAIYKKLQNHPEIVFRPMFTRFEDRVIQKALERGKKNLCTPQNYLKDPFCELLHRVGAPMDLSLPRLEERAKKALEGYMDTMIASGLYASWHVSGEIAGISLPCSREQLFGPNPFMRWLVSSANVSLNICGQGLSTDSCKRAVHTITAWEVDFDWTVSQHAAGARFAAKVCKPLPQGKSSMDSFCDASPAMKSAD